MRPADVTGVRASTDGLDVQLTWDTVASDILGHVETIDHYRVYRGEISDFVPDRAGGSNLLATPTTPDYVDGGAGPAAASYFYLISAVDADGNESNTGAPLLTTPPALTGSWTSTTIELDWTDAQPAVAVAGYRVYYGKAPGQYDFVDDVGTATSHSLSGLETLVNWYLAVAAVDVDGNETALSNEWIEAVDGTVKVRAEDGDELCWGASDCTPTDPTRIQRDNGWQILVPVHFPEGDWTSVNVDFTIESRLCEPPAQGTISKCGPGNPCVSPPCNGGYNPCGDPWDRTAQLFMVLDDCIDVGGSCITQNNLELIRAVTPFGTDAELPDGSGTVPPRVLSMDITPYASLLTGDRYIGVEIGHYVQKGWWVTVDFTFSERPDLASPKPPADGIQVLGFGDYSGVGGQLDIPPTATDVKMRLFTTGHGGSTFCDGGTNNAMACTSNADCPGGGVCNPCDEFCHRENQIWINGAPLWRATPWRTDCNASPGCSTWNACGYPSCTFPRAGWCPGTIACLHDAPCDNDIDFDAYTPAGGSYSIDYMVRPINGSWTVSLVAFWYE